MQPLAVVGLRQPLPPLHLRCLRYAERGRQTTRFHPAEVGGVAKIMVIQCPNCSTYLSIDFIRCPNCGTELTTPDLERLRSAEQRKARWLWPTIVVGGILCLMAWGGLILLIVGIWRAHGPWITIGILVGAAITIVLEPHKPKTFTDRLNDAVFERSRIK